MNTKLLLATAITAMTFSLTAGAEQCAPSTEIWSTPELEAFAKDVTCVDGELTIGFDGTEVDVDLPNLTKVKNGISFGGGASLRELRMDKLMSVGENIFISMPSYPQANLRLVSMPNLIQVGGIIDISAAPKLKPENVLVNPAVADKINK